MQAPRYDARLFARRLDEAITLAGTSNRALARESGVHITQIGRWRSGLHRPAYDGLVLLATALARALPGGGGDLIPGLFAAAGYAAPAMSSLAAELPELVAGHAGDPEVMRIWRSGVPEGAALAMIQTYLDWLAGQGRDGERQAGLPRLALS